MSIASKLQLLQQDVTNARTAITAKGGTVTPSGGSSQLATDIATIPSGGNLKDISPITANGTYKVFDDLIIVDSLKGNGTAYFPTDIILPDSTSLDSRYEIELCLIVGGVSSGYIYGCKGTGSYTYNFYGYDVGSGGIQIINGYYDFYPSYTRTAGTEIVFRTEGAYLYINGAQKSSQGTAKYFTNPTPLYIFAHNNGSTLSNIFHDSSFKYLKIKNSGGNLLYHFVPCRTSNNVPKILEKVSGNVYDATGDTTGMTFGADIEDLSYDGFASPIQVNVSQIKYGAGIEGILGDTIDGVLQVPFTNTSLDFTGVTHINADVLRYKFYCNPAIIGVNFPNLTNISTYAMQYAFYASSSSNGNIISLSMPNLTSVAAYGLQYAFYNQKLTNIDINLPLLNSVAASSFSYCFNNSNGLKSFTTSALTSITANSAFGYCFQNCINTDLEVKFNNLQTISANTVFQNAFANSKIYNRKVAHPFPDLVSINGNSNFGSAFTYCTPMRVVFDKLEYIGNTTASTYSTFSGAFNYANMGNNGTEYDKYGLFMPALKVIGQNSTSSRQNFTACFNSSNNRHTMHFYDLTTVYNASTTTSYGQFNQCNAKRYYMPKVTDLGTNNKNCFYSNTLTEEIHFGKENQATIEAMTGYSTKFGATNATIYFDMINHIMVNGINYYRDGAKCDLDNWYFAWTNPVDINDTIYTTNFKDPAVGDTVYTKSGSTYVGAGTITAVS